MMRRGLLHSVRFLQGAALAAGVLALGACATQDLRVVPPVVSTQETLAPQALHVAYQPGTLTVMTLNLAHARAEGFHQLFQGGRTAVRNLDDIALLMAQQAPDVVAFQEADGPSFWSGGFDHVDYLAQHQGNAQYVRGEHARGAGLSYGTALLSRLDLRDPLAVTFDPEHSTTPKGFVVSTIQWPGMPWLSVDVVSLHLDPLGRSLREHQARELITTLKSRGRPLIVMGDFNAEWQREGSVLHLITETLGLKAYGPERSDLMTFPRLDERLDWILVSPALSFVTYYVLPDPVSDHRAVVAEIALAEPRPPLWRPAWAQEAPAGLPGP